MSQTNVSDPQFSSDGENHVPEHAKNLKDGTYHQHEMGAKVKRIHFFSSLDRSYADAVHRDASTVEYSEKEEVCPTLSKTYAVYP